jgi:CheY-like chemotaxis protein
MPRLPAIAPAKPETNMTSMVETSRKAPPKMLIADDDPAVVGLLAARCVKMGFNVDTAANGIQLLIKARQNHPDIMIIDVNMPELDGISACARLLEPGSKPVDVVVITANTDPDLPDRCESLGMYYGNKRFEFWKSIEAALVDIFPDMTDKIVGLEMQSKNAIPQERPRVLLVDDDPAIQHFLASRLGKHGIETLYASDATQGYRIASKARPSAIIVDNFMPNGDAKYLLSRLRSTADTGSIPVIVISARQLDTITEQNLRREICGRPGAAHIFRKSFDTDELFGALKKYCRFD